MNTWRWAFAQRTRALLCLSTAGLLVASSALGAPAGRSAISLNREPIRSSGQIEVFVRLQTPSVSELNIEAKSATGALAQRSAQLERAELIGREQAAIRSALIGLGARILSAHRIGANGLRVRLPIENLQQVRQLPGVRSVGRVEIHQPDNTESVPWIGAVEAAERFGLSGKGIRIAVIDTGIDYLHANLGGSGSAAEYAANDKNAIEPGTFPTAKVIGGFDFAGPTYDANDPESVPQPDPDPLDGNGHGSHVAGSAAGLGVPGRIGAGVAPDARLYALKVFSDTSGSTNVTSLAIDWAMDPNGDGDMSDHAHVINMSLGSSFGEPGDPSAISAENAVALGIIVVASAGNSGNVPYVTGAPAAAAGAISVAATTPGGRALPTLNILQPAAQAGTKASVEGLGSVQFRMVGTVAGTVVRAEPLLGCEPLSNASAVAGNIALIVRGVCNFVDKYQNAQNAGARAVIVFNDGATPARVAPFAMGGIGPQITIPGVMISSTDGIPLAAAASTTTASAVQARIDVAPSTAFDDQLASFTSRGPTSADDSAFKPDLSAPGVGIISTAVGSGTLGLNNQGTSMAAPHVAGAAALLREQHPDLAPSAVKALLQNSSVDAQNSADSSLALQGVGVIRVDRAAALTSHAGPAGVSFGRLNPQERVTVNRSVTLTNLRRGARTYAVTHVPHTSLPGATVSCPEHVRVGSRGERAFQIGLRFDPAIAAAAGVFDESAQSQREIDGWCVLNDGGDALRVGYLAVLDPASRLNAHTRHDRVVVTNHGPAAGVAEAFTFVSRESEGESSHTYGSIGALGVRRGDPALYGGLPVIEFGLAVERPWQHISNLTVSLFLDLDRDGTDDVRLVAADWSSLSPTGVVGTYVTAQIDAATNEGFLDWIAQGWDFNDRVATLPFTLQSGGGLVSERFDYRLVLTDRQGAQDIQTGTIDLAEELVADLNSFTLADGERVEVGVTRGQGRFLWFFPGNRPNAQAEESEGVQARP